MERIPMSLPFALALFAATACEPGAKEPAAERDSAAMSARDSMTAVSAPTDTAHGAEHQSPAGHPATGHAATGEGGQALLPIMQRLGSEMTALTYALMTDDYATVTRSTAAIAGHAPISATELERIHGVLGPDMAVFEAFDESVHVASASLHEAARARQLGVVVERLGDVQRGCVSCHARFRERLRASPARP